MTDSVRIVVCGDEGTGKSSLITCLVKDHFRSTKIQSTLPPLTIASVDNLSTTIVDTSALPTERAALRKEIRRGNVICLVYSDHYSYERVSLFWLPLFRSLGVNLPVVLCANKSDLYPDVEAEKEMIPIMMEFKEIDSCIRASAKEMRNVNELFYLCQRAVTHPIAPLYDAKEQNLKPAAVAALERIFFLCDRDQDGLLSDSEIQDFQRKCFNKTLSADDLSDIKATIRKTLPEGATESGINRAGFILLNKFFAEKGRHETIWSILRTFHYTDSLSLQDSFLHPQFEVPENASAELSPIGYRFFVDLFLLFDKDNDGGLNEEEIQALFAPTPGLPASWVDSSFPSSTVRSEAGHITLQGWLAQWSMTTFQEPKTTLEYLAYLGFESPSELKSGISGSGGSGNTTAALKVTKPRRKKRRQAKVERNVVLCYIVGSAGCGKSTILDVFLNRGFSGVYCPTIRRRTAINSVEMQGGKQCYLILEELGELEPAILSNPHALSACDVLLFTYDSSDPTSFPHLANLITKHPHLTSIPSVFAALKADRDKTTQRFELQPEEYTRALGMSAPLHVSAAWAGRGGGGGGGSSGYEGDGGGVQGLFVAVAEAALKPESALPKKEEEGRDWNGLYIAAAVGAATCAMMWFVWKRTSSGS